MGRLHDLHLEQGQSPWLDNLRRGWVTSGELERWVDRGVRGLTSNPTIFQKAIESTSDYDEQFGDLVASGTSIDDAYWDLVTTDIRSALGILAPVHESSGGADGLVSVEVAPSLAHDTDGTIAAARHLHQVIDAPNLLVKIPGTAEGLPAITTAIAEGISVNVTLLFSVDRYAQVIESYLQGLEAHPGDLTAVSSVTYSVVDTTAPVISRVSRLPEANAAGWRSPGRWPPSPPTCSWTNPSRASIPWRSPISARSSAT